MNELRDLYVQNFGPPLRNLCPFPEGIDVATDGTVYVSSMAMHPVAPICLLKSDGRFERVIAITAGVSGIVALGGILLVGESLIATDFGGVSGSHGRVLRIDVRTGAYEVLASELAAPNGLTLLHEALLFSDSYQGAINLLPPNGGRPRVLASSDAMRPTGSSPVGVNGVAIDHDKGIVFCTNTAQRMLLRVPLKSDSTAGEVMVVADGLEYERHMGVRGVLQGADGIVLGSDGLLYVCANGANELQVFSIQGELVGRACGEGPHRFASPASIAEYQGRFYVTNSALPNGQEAKVSMVAAA